MLLVDPYLSDANKRELKEFFSQKEIIDLLSKNNFTDIFSKFITYSVENDPSNVLTKFLDISDINFLPYMIQIPPKAFCNCRFSKNSFKVPGNIKSIQFRAFYSCIGLDSLYIPKSVITFGSRIFYDSKIKDVYFEGSEEEVCKACGYDYDRVGVMTDIEDYFGVGYTVNDTRLHFNSGVK